VSLLKAFHDNCDLQRAKKNTMLRNFHLEMARAECKLESIIQQAAITSEAEKDFFLHFLFKKINLKVLKLPENPLF